MTEFIAKRYRVSEGAVAGYVAAAYRAGVPIFCPAIADSSIGMGLSQGRHKRKGSGHIDVIGDIEDASRFVKTQYARNGKAPKGGLLQRHTRTGPGDCSDL